LGKFRNIFGILNSIIDKEDGKNKIKGIKIPKNSAILIEVLGPINPPTSWLDQ
jgi:hypothetical protein